MIALSTRCGGNSIPMRVERILVPDELAPFSCKKVLNCLWVKRGCGKLVINIKNMNHGYPNNVVG